MRKIKFFILGLAASVCFYTGLAYAAQTLIAQRTEELPVIDGKDTDSVWSKAKEIVTRDKIANIDIHIKAIYTDKDICFLVKFPCPKESRTHKSWVWNKEMDVYTADNDREDVFQFVFNMEPHPVDLSIYADNNYKADCWFWKAHRTDPVGYADDKMNILSDKKIEKATELTSRTGKTMYLYRPQDQGQPAFETKVYEKYEGDRVPGFIHHTPTGSVADIRAKGVYKDGYWTIEFLRALNTGHNDDVQFDINKEYLFGVSRYEIAGRDKPEPSITQPLYGCGDVGEELKLSFGKN